MTEKKPSDQPTPIRTLDYETAKAIVFGTVIARSVEVEKPHVIVQVTAALIWDNLNAYLATGDWPDRRRTADEIDAEEVAAA